MERSNPVQRLRVLVQAHRVTKIVATASLPHQHPKKVLQMSHLIICKEEELQEHAERGNRAHQRARPPPQTKAAPLVDHQAQRRISQRGHLVTNLLTMDIAFPRLHPSRLSSKAIHHRLMKRNSNRSVSKGPG